MRIVFTIKDNETNQQNKYFIKRNTCIRRFISDNLTKEGEFTQISTQSLQVPWNRAGVGVY